MSSPEPPTFPAWVDRRTRHGVWIIRVRCGYCDRIHTHGGGEAEIPDIGGHRCAHCVLDFPADLPGYLIASETDDIDWDAEKRAAKSIVSACETEHKRREEEEHQRVLDRITEVNEAFSRSAVLLTSRGRTTMTQREQDLDFLRELRAARDAARKKSNQ